MQRIIWFDYINGTQKRVKISMQKEIIKKWSNKDNHAFYDDMPLRFFVAGAKRSGVQHGEDVKQVRDIIFNADSILEVGAGYGRVLKYILEMGYKGELDAVEYEKQYYDFCMERYADKVNLYNADILEWHAPKQYDLILWMWSGITEFCEKEQAALFRSFAHMLKPGGQLVVELMWPSEMDSDRVLLGEGSCKFIYNRPGGYLFFPSRKILRSYSAPYYSKVSLKRYKASEPITRNIYLFTRSSCLYEHSH